MDPQLADKLKKVRRKMDDKHKREAIPTIGEETAALNAAISQAARRKELLRIRRSVSNNKTGEVAYSPPQPAGQPLAAGAQRRNTIQSQTQARVYEPSDSSSDEEDDHVELSPPEPTMSQGPSLLDDTDSPSTADFANFGNVFGNEEEVVAEYVPPTFDVPVLEQRPEEPMDLSPLENPPRRPPPEVYLESKTLLRNITLCKPISNPLTGNVICCRMKRDKVVIHEMELATGMEVACTVLLDAELQQKIMTVYGFSALNVKRVLQLSAGLHKPPGQTRVRLSALVEFTVLTPLGTTQSQVSLVIWQWGYAPNSPIALQSLLSPPNHADFTYQATSLTTGDGLVFLAGYAQRKGPCVFVARPTVKDTWAANFLGQSASSISCLAVTREAHRRHKLLAIAMQDGTVSVWTYEAAVDRKAGKVETKLILPLCRLDGLHFIRMEPVTRLAGDDTVMIKEGKMDYEEYDDDDDDVHFCTHLEWKTPDSSFNSLLYLAAAFTNGIAIFHVQLPLLVDYASAGEASSDSSIPSVIRRGGMPRPIPKPKASAQLAQTVALRPFCVARWSTPSDWSGISWVDLGPHVAPSLAVWLEDEEVAAACMLGVIDLEDGGKFRILCEHFLPHSTGCLLSTSSMGSILCFGNGKIEALTPSLSTDASYFASIRHPISATPPGLDSAGYVSVSKTDKDGVVHVYTVSQCDRKLSEMNSMIPNATRLDWTGPVQRHFLVRSFVGDTKEAQETVDGDVTGGCFANVVCELNNGPGMVPHRIVKCLGSPLCAILFRRSLASAEGIVLDPTHVQICDLNKGTVVESRECRDIMFLPGKAGQERALVLGADGTMLYMLTRRISASSEAENDPTCVRFDDGIPFRPLLGFENDQNYIDCRRLLAVFSGNKTGVVVVGKRINDGLVCVVAGNREPLNGDMSRLIPHVKDGCLWLRHNEEVLSLSELPQYEEGRHCIAVATQSRVLLVSSARLNIRAESTASLASSNLASIGSHTVAFISCDNKVRYLCCLDGKFSHGIIATLPTPRFGHAPYTLMAMRPERFLYAQYHAGSRMVEQGEDRNSFLLPTCITRPALLLEPMVANALCEADNPGESTILLRAVIERFGRKVSSFPHGDDEGIGVNGTGLTQQVIEMLAAYGLKHPASWLLTGTSRFERDSPSKVLPSWMPLSTKSVAALNPDAQLHVVSNGDQYFMDYVKSPDNNMVSTLPRPSDPSSVFSRELAKTAIQKGDVAGALKLLDLAGTEASENAMLHVVLALQADPFADVTLALKALCGICEEGRSSSSRTSASSIAALALDLRTRRQKGELVVTNGQIPKVSDELCRRWMPQLAPSVQRSQRSQRVRHRLLGEEAIDKAVTRKLENVEQDAKWNNPCNETKHVWNEGPFKNRENMLLLDRMEDWLGRKRPAILGKEGAEIALERGEKTLADILNRADYDDDSFGVVEDELGDGNGWIDNIGEGRTDDDNLSAYFRMSEGADEDSAWRADGLADLTKYQNKIKIINHDMIKLQETTSSVDEGEAGKVRLLYDIVFDEPQDDSPAGFLIEVPRGSSCDVGILHGPIQDSRKRCTLEFWFHVPPAEEVVEEIILARRCVTKAGDDLSKLCVASDRESALWELALLPTGELEFRSSGGTILNSSDGGDEGDFGGKNSDMMGDFNDDDSMTDVGVHGEVSWQRPDGVGGWNHVCLIFSSKSQEAICECSVTILMKGSRTASAIARIVPPGLEGDELEDSTAIDGVMAKSVLLFGLNSVGNLRFTEIRIWSCVRHEDDLKMMMYEYLRAAETKKKFKVKIRKKGESEKPSVGEKAGKLLAPPKSGTGRLAPPRSKDDGDRPRGLLLPPRSRRDKIDEGDSEVVSNPAKNEDLFSFIPSLEPDPEADDKRSSMQRPLRATPFPQIPGKAPPLGLDVDASGFPTFSKSVLDSSPMYNDSAGSSGWEASENFFSAPPPVATPTLKSIQRKGEAKGGRSKSDSEDAANSTGSGDSLYGVTEIVKSAVPLSRQLRSNPAAALVRGPPATRHFGGNRGGLAGGTKGDRATGGRFGVGSIAICGAEKTVVYKFDRSPPGKIYPIGASGAIISDEMDDDGSEYLCCFLAKDKRMVVFELMTKTVVVELQMTTKLNYWRYLPPQAHGHTLVFTLITPVGGFHWMPLDEAPRPRQVWKRGPDLQGKKIVAYEEGGSNGKQGADARSMVALLLVSSASSGTPLEAWLMPISGDSRSVCVSSNLLGAALFRPYQLSNAFLPLMVTADKLNEKEVILEVQPLVESLSSTSSLGVSDVLTCAIIDQRRVRKVDLTPPILAMGTWPEVLISCLENLVVATLRRKGLMVAYEFRDGDLVLIRQESVQHYVVDAGVRPGLSSGEAEVVLLLSIPENSRDGKVVSFAIEYTRPQGLRR